MRIDIITLFPDMFTGVFGESILAIAQEKGAVAFNVHNLRDYTVYSHNQVDDRPYGGGPGMLLMPDPIFRAVEAVEQESDIHSYRIALSPGGKLHTQTHARSLVSCERLMLLCGRYEGFDHRVIDGLGFHPVSVGNFVVSGGEIPAMIIIESVVRLLPDVLGNSDSIETESFSDEDDSVLEYPQYTRPEEYRGMKVPDVLLSGNHEEIREWREKNQSRRGTGRNDA